MVTIQTTASRNLRAGAAAVIAATLGLAAGAAWLIAPDLRSWSLFTERIPWALPTAAYLTFSAVAALLSSAGSYVALWRRERGTVRRFALWFSQMVLASVWVAFRLGPAHDSELPRPVWDWLGMLLAVALMVLSTRTARRFGAAGPRIGWLMLPFVAWAYYAAALNLAIIYVSTHHID